MKQNGTFKEMTRRYGYGSRDFDESRFDNPRLAWSQQARSYGESITGNYLDDIGNSSPCPPGRGPTRNNYLASGQQHRVSTIDEGSTMSYSDDHNFDYLANDRRNPQERDHSLHSSQRPSHPRLPFATHVSRRFAPLAHQYEQVEHTAHPHAYSQASSSRSEQRSEQQAIRPATPRQQHQTGNAPLNTHGIRLKPVSDLPDMYRALFKFGVFNAVQSACFDQVMHSDDNMVISAPTGSGKTALFELSIIRMLSRSQGRTPKCIYVAPTKALCSEKYRDWTEKFQPLGIKCCELTGDTVHFGKTAWGDARDASIIVTTAEKWDSLTRNWSEHGQILSQIQLFLVDEIHILNESRGSTLEVVISRMKTRGTGVRFIFVSATVPNIQDVANWVGAGPNGGPAVVKEFGDEFRPCKLSRHVYGFPRKQGQNDFQFTRILDFRLYGILQQHSVNKPILVFCATRKGVVATAEQLLKEYEDAAEAKKTPPWAKPRRSDYSFHDKRLDKLAVCGIGVHHAGMTMDDRRLTEDLYLKGTLRVLAATSTLAVESPLVAAHTVVIKGVKLFQNNASQEYSDLDIVQMMGRAGRPQFDTEGVAIVLCEAELEPKYKALAQGQTVLESCLHKNLSEHINSEIGLGTIRNIDTAKQWLHNSFLFQRIQSNPRHYAIGKASNQTWQEKINDMVTDSITQLQKNELVMMADSKDSLSSTAYGDIMSKYYIRQTTMSMLLKLPSHASVRELLEAICTAEELSDIKMRSGEKQIYAKLRTHDDIRFKPKKIENVYDKIFLIIQAILGGISLNSPEYKNGDNQPQLESITVFRHIARIARALVEVAIERQYGAQVKHGLELLRCLTAKTWEDRPNVLRQIEQIGEKSIKVLAQFGITSLASLRKQDTLRLEQLMNRRPPFGNELLASLKAFPEYFLEITEVDVATDEGRGPVEVEISIKCGVLDEKAASTKPKKSNRKGQDWTVVLTVNSDMDFVDFRRIPTHALKGSKTFSIVAELTKPSQSLLVMISSETMAGVTVTETYKPNLPSHLYPTLNTRPMTLLERDLEGLEDDPDFWNMTIDDDDDDQENADVLIKDLTIPREPRGERDSARETQSRSSKEVYQPQPVMQATSSKAKDSQTDHRNLKRLPNGNYECNHPCKNKTNCRHYCCHEGLPKPPPLTKKQITNTLDNVPAQTQTEPSCPRSMRKKDSHSQQSATRQGFDRVATKAKSKAPPKPAEDLQRLEDLHASTNVRERLKLSGGKRIKVDDGKLDLSRSSEVLQPQNAKRKRIPNFDIDFVNIQDARPSFLPDVQELSDSEELPEPNDLLNSFVETPGGHQNKTSTDTDYSDAGFDSLIRAADVPNASSSTRPANRFSSDFSKSPLSSVIDLASPSPPKKRRLEESDNLRSLKRRRYETESVGDAEAQGPSVYSRQSNERRLFLPGSDSPSVLNHSEPASAYVPPGPRDDEDFVLDESLFVPDPLPLPSPSRSSNSTVERRDNQATNIAPHNANRRNIQVIDQPYFAHDEPDTSFRKEMAEIEDWFYNSGSVVIVNDMEY